MLAESSRTGLRNESPLLAQRLHGSRSTYLGTTGSFTVDPGA